MEIAAARATQNRKAPSRSMLKTYWRMRLNQHLRRPKLLRAVTVNGSRLKFVTSPWSEYWGYIPRRCRGAIHDLRAAWETYVRGGCEPSRAAPYSRAYFAVLRALLGQSSRNARSCPRFLAKVLGFENFVLCAPGSIRPFALATASFRSPVLLSFTTRGLRKHNFTDPSLLALAIGSWEGEPLLFHHYRRQRLLRNTDDALLFFVDAEVQHRSAGFAGLETLTSVLASEWDSRAEERSRRLTDKFLVPVLEGLLHTSGGDHRRPTRILDIGSETGLLTSKMVLRVIKSGILGARKLELCLLDLFPADPEKHFTGSSLLSSLRRVDYVRGDCRRILAAEHSAGLGQFDVALLLRILHNMSLFGISHTDNPEVAQTASRRYKFFPHLSDYYALVAELFPRHAESRARRGDIFYPVRRYNPSALLSDATHSLIDALLKISRGIVIEDGDLEPDALIEHIRRHVNQPVRVCDFSQALRLSVNHLYWIAAAHTGAPAKGNVIWPR